LAAPLISNWVIVTALPRIAPRRPDIDPDGGAPQLSKRSGGRRVPALPGHATRKLGGARRNGQVRRVSATTPQTGTVDEALAMASRLVQSDPARAAAQSREVLRVAPGHPQAQFLLGASLRRLGDLAGALGALEPLVRAQPRSPQAQFELGMALSAAEDPAGAERALRAAVALKPAWTEAWRALADILWLAGEARAADEAYARCIAASVQDPALMEAAAALCDERLAVAERLLRDHLKTRPDDVAALRMLAEIGTRLGRYADAEALLQRALELAPGFAPARHNLAVVLYRQNRAAEALVHIDQLLKVDPSDPGYRNLKAAALSLTGDYQGSIELYEDVLARFPGQAKGWLSYGHALKTAGRQADSIAAYRRSLDLEPGFGEAFWSLANLKTFHFTDQDLAGMRAQLERPALSDDDRLHLHYALGKALEDAGESEAAFGHYAEGARIRRDQIDYDAAETTAQLERSRALFTPGFFREREGWGCQDPSPIFVVGLPRSGSTLVEQILASHSEVEGTMELPDLVTLVRSLGERRRKTDTPPYPDVLDRLGPDEIRRLGELYIERTRIQRRLGRPFFIDKLPNNFLHAGLIRLILPKAKIVDARRSAMATCFSAFKQHFARGQNYSYDLTELGLYYRDYVALMDHFDEALPGHVHRVIYERIVEDTEAEVRRLLEFCDLPFQPACLEFHRNARPVRTASSEQVRRPIFRDGLDQWRRFEPWLGPLKRSLGELAEG
jgi:tetratricopeptide (TPR) repeat protein